MTKAALYELIREYLRRPNQSDTSIDGMASMVEAKLNTVLRRHPRMYTSTTLTLDSDGNADLPSDISAAAVVRDGSGRLPQYESQLRGTFARGVILSGQVASVIGSSGDVVLEYYQVIPPLESNDSNWILEHFSDIYVYGVLSESRVYLRDDQRLAGYQALFAERLEALRLQGWNQNYLNSRAVTVSA
jgi:hypothetical protein